MCSISRDPLRDECTICTAVAPDPVFTVRRYGDIPLLYGPGLVRKFSHPDPRNRRSANWQPRTTKRVTSQVTASFRRPLTVAPNSSHAQAADRACDRSAKPAAKRRKKAGGIGTLDRHIFEAQPVVTMSTVLT
jgi:hypothetical protein